MTARRKLIGLQEHTTHIRLIVTVVVRCFSPLTAKCDGFHCQTAQKISIACVFGNSKQLQRHNSVHLSSVYTDYSFSSFFTALAMRALRRAVLAVAIPSVRPSVRPSVCPSHAGIVSKPRHVARCSLHCWIV